MKFICLLFSCCHNYNNVRFGFFFLAIISTVGGEINLCFLSRCNDEKEQQVLTKDEILVFLGLLALQAACPKAYKSITTNSFEIVISLSM